MIRLTSTNQALSLRGTVPELAILRMSQFQGTDGTYDPDTHGYIIVLQDGDDPERELPELGEKGLFTGNEDWPLFDYVEAFEESGQLVFEAVAHLDDDRTVAVIIPFTPDLDPRLRTLLEGYLPEVFEKQEAPT